MTTDPGWWAALLGGGGVGAIIKSFLQHRPETFQSVTPGS